MVAHYLSPTKWEALFDQVNLKFDGNGKLSEIVGHSQSDLQNSAWQAGGDAFSTAIRKGQGEWIHYTPTAPEASLIFRTVFGRRIEDLIGLSFSSVTEIINAAREARAVKINSLLEFRD
ncbi:MAG: hypothetical protein IPK68_03610 [Bdellovibrionales bacterium]|nr:hypothetical protein [Bdellovibrionales bacterium]